MIHLLLLPVVRVVCVVLVVRVRLVVLHKVPRIVCRDLFLMIDFFNKKKQLCKTENCWVNKIRNTPNCLKFYNGA